MKKCLFLTAILCSSSALAASGDSYFGGGYHLGKYEEDSIPSASPTAIKLEYGKYFTDNIAVEGQFSFGLGDDTISADGINIDLELKQAISLFVKGDLNLSETVNLYGLLGFTKGKLKASASEFDFSVTESDSGLSYGAGIELNTANGLNFSVEYLMYLSEDTYDYSGVNLGIAKKF